MCTFFQTVRKKQETKIYEKDKNDKNEMKQNKNRKERKIAKIEI